MTKKKLRLDGVRGGRTGVAASEPTSVPNSAERPVVVSVSLALCVRVAAGSPSVLPWHDGASFV